MVKIQNFVIWIKAKDIYKHKEKKNMKMLKQRFDTSNLELEDHCLKEKIKK